MYVHACCCLVFTSYNCNCYVLLFSILLTLAAATTPSKSTVEEIEGKSLLN